MANMEEKYVPRLKVKYQGEIAPALMKKFNYTSTMQIPRLDKITVNVGCGEARDNSKGAGCRVQRPGQDHRPEGPGHKGQEVCGQLQTA